MTAHLLMWTFRIWLVELPAAALNWFLLAGRIYRPRAGRLRAHQIAMVTRIVWVFALAYVLLRLAGSYTTTGTLIAGAFWMGLWLAFEWVGGLLTRRPVREILVGWHVTQGYLWPYVLLAYLLGPVTVGLVLLLVHS